MKISEETFNRLKEMTEEISKIRKENNLIEISIVVEDDGADKFFIRGDSYYGDFYAAKFNHKVLEDTTYQGFLRRV